MSSTHGLLLIADIGGYTTYMSTHRMSLAHAEVNTARLLGTVIDAVPGLELVEIEGDAAFLYREVGTSDPDQLVEEVVRAASAMHRAFHVERQYVARNLCPCAGCKEVADLSLKFVAHVGEVATQTIRDRLKLVGIDVILVHRLLKNTVPLREYVLLTEQLYREGSPALTGVIGEVEPDLEGFGPVKAYYVDVEALGTMSPEPLPTPTWRGRLTRTAYAAGAGLPYMLGRKGRGRATAAG